MWGLGLSYGCRIMLLRTIAQGIAVNSPQPDEGSART